MKIISRNADPVHARLPRVTALLACHEPGLVCLQEIKTSLMAFPGDDLAAAGYQAVVHGRATSPAAAWCTAAGVDRGERRPASGGAGPATTPPGHYPGVAVIPQRTVAAVLVLAALSGATTLIGTVLALRGVHAVPARRARAGILGRDAGRVELAGADTRRVPAWRGGSCGSGRRGWRGAGWRYCGGAGPDGGSAPWKRRGCELPTWWPLVSSSTTSPRVSRWRVRISRRQLPA